MQNLGRLQAREKGPKDLVTEADTTSQRVVKDILLNAFPEDEFVGEEDAQGAHWPRSGDPSQSDTKILRWVVDPLDGTANYVHQLPGFAVSIGLACGNDLLAGVVYDPWLEECFVAIRGGGASLNGRPIRVSGCARLEQAMVAVSFPPDVTKQSPDIPRFERLLIACQSLRRLGSAALNLCYVAAGRMDAYWATSCKPWDVAAGVVLVQEAGGVVTDIDGGPFVLAAPVFAAAANPALHGQFLRQLGNDF
jgi:myo-inositol-1(or 4)-monophosphatase